MSTETNRKGLFTSDQAEEVAKLVGIQDDVIFAGFEGVIVGALALVRHFQEEHRNAPPDIMTARRWAADVHVHAHALVRLLKEQAPKASYFLFDHFHEYSRSDPDGVWSPELSGRVRLERLDALLQQLNKIEAGAKPLLDNDRKLRSFFGLEHASEISVVISHLWPTLFGLWEEHGRLVAHTPGGPLYRFLSIVHAAGGLSEPKQGTFKDAVTRWKNGGKTEHEDAFIMVAYRDLIEERHHGVEEEK